MTRPVQAEQSTYRVLLQGVGVPHPLAAAIYCSALWILPFATAYVRFGMADTTAIAGLRTDFLVQFLLLAIAFVAWLKSPRFKPTSRLLNLFLAATLISWLCLSLISAYHGDQVYREYFIVAAAVIMIWVKPPARDALIHSVLVLLIGIALLEVVTFVTADGRATWLASYSLPWNQHLGLDRAWTSYVMWPAFSGFIAACSLALSFSLSGIARWVFGLLATVGVLASASESMIIGAIFGSVVFAVGSLRGRGRIAAGIAAIAGLVTTANIASRDTTGSGRVPLWFEWLGSWREEPIFGSGSSEAEIIAATGHLHPHNLFINTLVKSGVIGLVAVLTIFVILFVITGSRAWRGDPAPLALAVVVLTGAMTDYEPRLYNWSIGFVFLILAGLLATSSPVDNRKQALART